MKIVHILTRLLRAGSEENTVSSCVGQIEAGHEVYLIHGRDFDDKYRRSLDPRIKVITDPDLQHSISLPGDFRAVRGLARRLRALQPDIVHTHQSKAGILGRVAARLARSPVVVHGVHIVPFESVNAVERWVYVLAERMVARWTTAYIDVSRGVRDLYVKNRIGRADQHHVIYSGMDVERFKRAPLPEDWRELLGVGEGQPRPRVILMLAALEPRKRHAELVQLFAQVSAKVPDVMLLLAGEGPYRPEVEAVIAASGLGHKIRLLGHRPDPEKLVALADICILTSVREGLPRVVVQYLAGGKPAVVTRIDGIEEIIEPQVNGIITEPDQLAETSQHLIRLLTTQDELARLSQGALATDTSRWHTSTMCRDINALYSALPS